MPGFTRCQIMMESTAGDLMEFPEEIRVVQLPGLNQGDARERTSQFVGAQFRATDPAADPQDRITAQSQILDILSWLWDTTTAPILDAIGYTKTPDPASEWPRIWWYPVGFLTYLPLHAAGHHQDLANPDQHAQPRTVLDRVISSYATTVRGLSYARSHHPDINDGTVIVAVPDASGMSPLPGVLAESEVLSALMPNARVLADPTHDEALEALADSPIAHFSCHGRMDWNDPAA
jgi:hypothetical protein